MAARTKNVFVDTEVFDHHWLDFNSSRLKRLARLASAGELNLVLTEVTVSEIEAHIAEKAAESVKQIKDFRKVNRVVRDIVGVDKLSELSALTAEELQDRMRREFRDFLKDSKATVVSVNQAKASEVFHKYFRKQPPFDKPDKKVEFPDAFSASALEGWCNGQELYIVSGDADWGRLSEGVGNFIHLGRLDELLEEFADTEAVVYLKETITAENPEVLAALKQQFDNGNVYFFVDDSVIDGEVDDIEDLEIAIEEINVVEASDGSATIGLVCTVDATLSVTGMDEDSMWRDPDDGSYHSVWTRRGSVERQFEVEGTIEVSYDLTGRTAIKIESARIDEESIAVSVEEGELETQYDERDEDDDYEYDPNREPDDDDDRRVEF